MVWIQLFPSFLQPACMMRLMWLCFWLFVKSSDFIIYSTIPVICNCHKQTNMFSASMVSLVQEHWDWWEKEHLKIHSREIKHVQCNMSLQHQLIKERLQHHHNTPSQPDHPAFPYLIHVLTIPLPVVMTTPLLSALSPSCAESITIILMLNLLLSYTWWIH